MFVWVVGCDELHGDVAIQVQVVAEVDLPHATAADGSFEAEFIEKSRRFQVRHSTPYRVVSSIHPQRYSKQSPEQSPAEVRSKRVEARRRQIEAVEATLELIRPGSLLARLARVQPAEAGDQARAAACRRHCVSAESQACFVGRLRSSRSHRPLRAARSRVAYRSQTLSLPLPPPHAVNRTTANAIHPRLIANPSVAPTGP